LTLHSSYLQVGSLALSLIAHDDPCYSIKDHSDNIDVEYSGSMQGDCVSFQFSKLYLMYSATDVASAAVDFAKDNVKDGIVDSSLSRSIGRTLVCLPSPLHDCRSTPI
jgi:hypothetical protein